MLVTISMLLSLIVIFFKSAGEIMKKNRVTLILLKLVNVPNIF